DSMRPDKQMKIAGETDYFYAPLANRLGLYKIKTELENLSFRYRCPHEYADMESMLLRDQTDNRETMESFVSHIREVLDANDICARIEVEYRMPYSIWRKMQKNNRDFWHTEHRHFVSIIFPDRQKLTEKNTCLLIYSLLTDRFREKPGGIANYVDTPKGNGYRCFHVKLLSDHGQWEEVHISSEQMVKDSRMGCMATRSEESINIWLEKFRTVLKDLAQHSLTDSFIENVATSFYNDDIMVFTPKGRAIILPKKATALDFAFEVHSKIGSHAKYARINGKLSSIKTELRRGDCVEIGTDDAIAPQPDWQDHVLTYKAKRFLRTYLSTLPKPTYCRCKECHPIPGDEVIGFKEQNESVTVHKRNCPIVIRLATQFGDSIVSVDFKEEPDTLYPAQVHIKAIDRYHLLTDLTDCITNKLGLSIDSLHTVTEDNIVDCSIRFFIHSFDELRFIESHLDKIEGVEEVQKEDTW
ncbi:MAG: TGS domain-containing protein, partial [Marinilabiliaceae bacterium]